MSKPVTKTLNKKVQGSVLKMFKQGKSVRPISSALKLPRRQVMRFLQDKGLAKFSESSYL